MGRQTKQIDFSKLDWTQVMGAFGIHKDYLKKKEGPCPLCGGKTRFRFKNVDNRGSWFCHHCDKGGYGLNLIREFSGLPDFEIFKKIEEVSGGIATTSDPIKPPVPDDYTPEKVAANRTRLIEAWKGSSPINKVLGPVEKYLQRRVPGCDLSRLTDHVRYHPSMKCYTTDDNDKPVLLGRFPTMLCAAIDAEGTAITLHRTYLTADGNKAPVPEQKMQMRGVRKLNGAAVRIYEDRQSRILAVTEGFENGLAVATAYNYQFSVWSLINAGNLAVADIPRNRFDEVIIFADFDKLDPKTGYRTGEHYAKKLSERLQQEGFKVKIKFPSGEGIDFDDMWLEYYNQKFIEKASQFLQRVPVIRSSIPIPQMA